jgi:hypothetical protein
MAKELPYFKFEPSEWDNGNIQMCSREAKGLFIDLCSIYWSRLGELPYALALQKYCNGDATLINELSDNEIIIVKENQIIIEFLDEQLNEFQETSEKRRKAANKRWSNANGMQMHSKSNAIREDKIREKKIKKENSVIKEKKETLVFPFETENFKKWWQIWKDYKKEQHKFLYKSFASEQLALKKLGEMAKGFEQNGVAIIEQSIANGYKLKNNKNGKSITEIPTELRNTEAWRNA